MFVYNIKISKWKVLNELNDTDIKSFNSHLSRIKKKKNIVFCKSAETPAFSAVKFVLGTEHLPPISSSYNS